MFGCSASWFWVLGVKLALQPILYVSIRLSPFLVGTNRAGYSSGIMPDSYVAFTLARGNRIYQLCVSPHSSLMPKYTQMLKCIKYFEYL
jgi:hypothetical protein